MKEDQNSKAGDSDAESPLRKELSRLADYLVLCDHWCVNLRSGKLSFWPLGWPWPWGIWEMKGRGRKDSSTGQPRKGEQYDADQSKERKND